MQRSFWFMALFICILIGGFIYIGSIVTKLSGEKGEMVATETGVSPEGGETIFWGKGQCHTCHSIGKKGSGIRGPNLGGVGDRAIERAAERTTAGAAMDATGYLVESLAQPSAYVVKGFKPEMPLVYKPPIALSPDEVKAVVSYLQSQDGEVNIEAIVLPEEVMASAASGGGGAVEEWKPYQGGDVAVGEALFFDLKGDIACAKCHTIKGVGAKVGPDLTTVAATRSPQYIIESILEPSAVIASGFEPVKVKTKKGKIITGILKEDNEVHVLVMDSAGNVTDIPKDKVKKLKTLKTSVMPPFGNVIKMEDFHNLLAYLLTLK